MIGGKIPAIIAGVIWLLVAPALCRGDAIAALEIYAAAEAENSEVYSRVASEQQTIHETTTVRKPAAVAMLAPYKFKKGGRLQLPSAALNHDTYRMPLSYYPGVSSSFGMRYHPLLKRMIFHNGCDIPMPFGTPVYPAKSGTVTFAGWRGGYGNTVEVRHIDGSLTRYGHLSTVSVGVGEIVQQSKSILGRVGSTGISTGPHLHFEIITPYGKSVNPLAKLDRRWGLRGMR